MADIDIHIKGGTVVDGTRAPRYRADVWIRDGKVARVTNYYNLQDWIAQVT